MEIITGLFIILLLGFIASKIIDAYIKSERQKLEREKKEQERRDSDDLFSDMDGFEDWLNEKRRQQSQSQSQQNLRPYTHADGTNDMLEIIRVINGKLGSTTLNNIDVMRFRDYSGANGYTYNLNSTKYEYIKVYAKSGQSKGTIEIKFTSYGESLNRTKGFASGSIVRFDISAGAFNAVFDLLNNVYKQKHSNPWGYFNGTKQQNSGQQRQQQKDDGWKSKSYRKTYNNPPPRPKGNKERFTFDANKRRTDKKYDRYITLKETYVLRFDAMNKIAKEHGKNSTDYEGARNELNAVARRIKTMKEKYNFD